jgi:dTDP-4-dehydrorhamnose 3,5-epimerase
VEVRRLEIPEVLLLTPRRFADDRGFFSETYSLRTLREAGICDAFVQDNMSVSHKAGTVRGLHYQRPPHAQAKLVSVPRGRILDVVVDVRRGSPSWARHVIAELSSDDGAQVFVPKGFLHGYVTLEPDTIVAYKASDYYAPECDGVVRWDDTELAIDWGVEAAGACLSPKDAAAPAFAAFDSPFDYVAETGGVR